ncbi:MAG: lipocalin [Geminicoccaceae bacterium]|nr:MAG: lipocalin [Geminicoccaceae bacterium]
MRFKDPAWSPYVAGVLIGLLQIPAFLLVNTALGASSSYVTLGTVVGGLVDPAMSAHAYFASYVATAKDFWQLAMVLGIAAGAYLSARASGLLRQGFSPIWRRAAGIETLSSRALMAFSGGFILLFGARLAGGCASGHGLSGMAQLAIGSMVTVAAMFAAGIVIAQLFRRV